MEAIETDFLNIICLSDEVLVVFLLLIFAFTFPF